MIRCLGGKARYSAGTNFPGFASYLYHAKLSTTACTTLDAKKKKKNCEQAPLSETILKEFCCRKSLLHLKQRENQIRARNISIFRIPADKESPSNSSRGFLFP